MLASLRERWTSDELSCGIHFRFDNTASIESCSAVADYIFDNKMQRVD